MEKLTNDGYALLIGVDDYSAYDISMNQPKGHSDLPGGRDDVRAFWRILRRLGVKPENIRVLTSPRLDPADLEGATQENMGEAIQEEILAKVDWLAASIGRPPRPTGFMMYSGHGDFIEGEGLVICPTNTTGPNLDHSILFSRLQAIVKAHRASDNLTVLLDTCHAGAAGGMRRGGSLTGRALPKALLQGVPEISDRVLAACERDQIAYFARFSSVWRGAFAWAVGAVMDQWKAVQEGDNVQLDLSYGELLDRSRRLLEALSFGQTPMLKGAPGVAELPVFHKGPVAPEGETSEDPTGKQFGGQFDPDLSNGNSYTQYTGMINSESSQVLAVGVGSNDLGLNGYTEYWSLTQDFVDALQAPTTNTTLTFSKTSSASWGTNPTLPSGFPVTGTGALATFEMPTSPTWTALPSSSSPGNAFYYTDTSSTTPTYMGFIFNLTPPATTSSGAPVWTGSVTWLQAVPSGGQPSQYIVSTSGRTFTYQAAPTPSGYSWYSTQLTPVSWPTTTTQVNTDTPEQLAASSGPALASFNSKLYLACVDSSKSLQVYSSSDGSTFTWEATPASSVSEMNPAIASLTVGTTPTLCLAYVGSNDHLYSTVSTDGSSWSSVPHDSEITPLAGPSLAWLGSTLYLAFKDTKGHAHLVTSTTGMNWGSSMDTGTQTKGQPALAAFNGTLYLAYRDTSQQTCLQVISSSNGSTWTPPSPVGVSSSASPALAVWNGFLYLVYCDSSNNLWMCSSQDGSTWSGFTNLTLQLTSVATNRTPAATALGTSSLTLAFADTTTNHYIYTLTGT